MTVVFFVFFLFFLLLLFGVFKGIIGGTPDNNAYKNQKTKKGKKRQNRPTEIRFSGVPPIVPIKYQQQKTQGKIDPQKYVYQGSPYNAYKNVKNIDNKLGYPPLLSTKTPKI